MVAGDFFVTSYEILLRVTASGYLAGKFRRLAY